MEKGFAFYKRTCILYYRWLVAFKNNEVGNIVDEWSERIDDNGNFILSDGSLQEFVENFGIIPRFACVYELICNRNTSYHECNCGF